MTYSLFENQEQSEYKQEYSFRNGEIIPILSEKFPKESEKAYKFIELCEKLTPIEQDEFYLRLFDIPAEIQTAIVKPKHSIKDTDMVKNYLPIPENQIKLLRKYVKMSIREHDFIQQISGR